MVARKTWKRIFQIGIIVSIIIGAIYLSIYIVFLKPDFIRHYDTLEETIVTRASLISGDNESARYYDTDYLEVESVEYLFIHQVILDLEFDNLSRHNYWIRVRIRTNISFSVDIITQNAIINSTNVPVNESFYIHDLYVGEVGILEEGDPLEVRLYLHHASSTFLVEIDLVEIYIGEEKYPLSALLTTIGIVVGIILTVYVAYWYLNRRGFFTETDARRLLAKIDQEEKKINYLESDRQQFLNMVRQEMVNPTNRSMKAYALVMAILIMTLATTSIIGKHAVDIYILFVMGWAILVVYLPKIVNSPKRLIGVIILFIMLDGLIDGLSHHATGEFLWLQPPLLFGWDWVMYPYGSFLTSLYLTLFWVLIVPIRSFMIAFLFTRNYTNDIFSVDRRNTNLLLLFSGMNFIQVSLIQDWFNQLFHPAVPGFLWYVFPLGFWTVERMVIRTGIFLLLGIGIIVYTFKIQWRNKYVIGFILGLSFLFILSLIKGL